MMKSLKESGAYTLSEETRAALAKEFWAAWADDEETKAVIRRYYENLWIDIKLY